MNDNLSELQPWAEVETFTIKSLLYVRAHMYVHTQAHTSIHTYIYIHTHKHTKPCIHTNIHIHMAVLCIYGYKGKQFFFVQFFQVKLRNNINFTLERCLRIGIRGSSYS